MPTSGRQPLPEESFFQPPLVEVAALVLPVVSCDHPHRAQLFTTHHLHHGAVVGLVLDAVGDHQLFVGLLTRVDHLLALFYRGSHRLLA